MDTAVHARLPFRILPQPDEITCGPTWLTDPQVDLRAKLRAQMAFKDVQAASEGYLEFLELGGEVRFEDLTGALIRRYLNKGVPILTGLSAAYLYRQLADCLAAGETFHG